MADFQVTSLTKSNEVGPYDKNINRIRWNLESDNMLTNLSDSYIKLNVTILDGSNNPVNIEDYTLNDQVIGFGQNGMSYSPACLVRTARLISQKTGKYLEEVPYCNTWTQTKHQLLNDFESIIGNSIRSGAMIDFQSQGLSLEASISSFIRNPREVHIPLKDLFCVCKSTAFTMETTGGLRVELELENQQSLFDVTNLPKKQIKLPEVFTDASGVETIGFQPDSQTDFRSFYSPSQFNTSETQAFIPGPLKVLSPNGYLYNKTAYLETPALFLDVSGVLKGNTIRLKPKWKLLEFGLLNFTVGSLIELNFINQTIDPVDGTITEVKFKRTAKIINLLPNTNTDSAGTYGAGIVLDQMYYASNTLITGYVTRLDSFFLYNPSNSAQILYQDTHLALDAFIVTNELILSASQAASLVTSGITDASYNLIDDVKFNMEITTMSSNDGSGNVFCENDINSESPYAANILDIIRNSTNQTFTIPLTQENPKINSIIHDLSQNVVILSFEDLKLNAIGGPWSLQIGEPTLELPAGVITQAPFYNLNFFGIEKNTNPVTKNKIDYTYRIDRAEIVLYKSAMPKGFQANPLYTTMKLEIVDIPTPLSEFHRQFILEANTDTIWLMTPQWTKFEEQEPSLISSTRNIQQYRFSIDQLQNTNRLIDVMSPESNYISPLHLEKSFEAWSNSQYRLRTTQGLNSVEDSPRPVVCFPCKIYAGQNLIMNKSGSIFTNYIPNNTTKLLQVDLYGSEQEKIYPSSVFLWKEVIESFAGLQTRN